MIWDEMQFKKDDLGITSLFNSSFNLHSAEMSKFQTTIMIMYTIYVYYKWYNYFTILVNFKCMPPIGCNRKTGLFTYGIGVLSQTSMW